MGKMALQSAIGNPLVNRETTIPISESNAGANMSSGLDRFVGKLILELDPGMGLIEWPSIT